MTDPDRLERGRDKLREVHGERALATVESLGDLGRLIVEVAYGEVYSRPGLSLRERQITSVAALVATGRSSQLPVHLRSSLKAGLTPEELQEVIIQTATIAGFPPAMNAWSTLKTIVAETEGRLDRPRAGMRADPGGRRNPYLPAVRRPILVPLAGPAHAWSSRPAGTSPRSSSPARPPAAPPRRRRSASTGPVSTTPTFAADGCPVDEPAFCEQAAFLANALVLSDADAVFDLSRRVSMDCADLDQELFPQCDGDKDTLEGYVVSDARGEFFVDPPADYRRTLRFFVEAVDEEYSDELGGPQMQILGVSTCGKGADTSYHLVYLVGLGDPGSTLPGDRFLGTYELTQEGGTWAIGATFVGLYTDWQLALDDPLTQIACGDIQPWVGAAANLNPPQSESQPTPIPGTGPT